MANALMSYFQGQDDRRNADYRNALLERQQKQWGREDETYNRNELSRTAAMKYLKGDKTALGEIQDPDMLVKLQDYTSKLDEATQKKLQQGLLEAAQYGTYIDSLPPEQQGGAYEAYKMQLRAKGGDVSWLPPQWSPGMGRAFAARLGTGEQLFKQAFPEQPKPTELSRNLSDPTTRAWLERQEANKDKRSAFSLSLPDGTSLSMGGGIPGVPVTKKSVDASIESLTGAENALARLDGIEKSFTPEALTLLGRAKTAFAGAKDYMGQPLSADQEKALVGASQQVASLRDNLSAYVKEISGAAATDAERRFLAGVMPSESDSPTVLLTKLRSARERGRQILDRERKRLTVSPQGTRKWVFDPETGELTE